MRAAAALLLAASFAAGGPVGEGARSAEWSGAEDFSPGDTLVVCSARGSVRVTGERREGGLDVRARRVAGGAKGDEEVKRLAGEIRVVIRTGEEGGVVVETVLPPGGRGARSFVDRLLGRRATSWTKVDLEIRLPREANVRVETETAEIRLERLEGTIEATSERGAIEGNHLSGVVRFTGVASPISIGPASGRIDLRSSSGAIEARRVTGSLHANGTSGAITCYDITGEGRVRSVSGPVLVEECSRALAVETSSGAVDIIRCGADLSVATESGDLLVQAEITGPVRYALSSESGDVDLVLSGPPPGRIEARVGTGSIQCFYPVEIQEVTMQKLVAVAGPGRSILRLRSETGMVRVSRSD